MNLERTLVLKNIMSSTSQGTHCVGDEKPKQDQHTDQEACNICEQSHFSVGDHLVAPRLWSLTLKRKDSVLCQAAMTEGEKGLLLCSYVVESCLSDLHSN